MMYNNENPILKVGTMNEVWNLSVIYNGFEDPCYEQVRAIVKILNFIREAEVDDEIPPTSLVREFIGGNSFYR